MSYDYDSRSLLYNHSFADGPVQQVLLMARDCSSLDIPPDLRKSQPRKKNQIVTIRHKNERIEFFDLEDGEVFITRAPFTIERAWALPRGGLLLEPTVDTDDTTAFYSLFHPMALFHPVLLDRLNNEIRQICDKSVHIINAVHDEEFLFAFDEHERTHCVLMIERVNEPSFSGVQFLSVLKTQEGDENRAFVKSDAPTTCFKQVWKDSRQCCDKATKAFLVYGPVNAYCSIVYFLESRKLLRFVEIQKTLSGNLTSTKRQAIERSEVLDVAVIAGLNAVAVLLQDKDQEKVDVCWTNNQSLWTIDVNDIFNGIVAGKTNLQSSEGLSFFATRQNTIMRVRMLPIARNNTVIRCLNSIIYTLNTDHASLFLSHFYSCLPKRHSDDEFNFLFNSIFLECDPSNDETIDRSAKVTYPTVGNGDDDEKYWTFLLTHCKANIPMESTMLYGSCYHISEYLIVRNFPLNFAKPFRFLRLPNRPFFGLCGAHIYYQSQK
ncbi:hypothetical protein ACOME3_003913 [Neoechinorhynchus agilis]